VTFSGNQSAYRGGGLFGASAVRVRSTTFAGDVAAEGGGLYAGSDVKVANTILASAAGGNCAGTALVSSNSSIDTDGSCALSDPSDRTGVDPQLAPLADNGGATATHAIATTSPAIDGGNNATCPATDQRGVQRPVDGNGDGAAVCDIGAFEYLDQCPGDPHKFTPGACGCGQPDSDDNGNGVVDCLVNAELKARIARARVVLAALAEGKTPDQKALRAELKSLGAGIAAYAASHKKGIVLSDPKAKATKLARRVRGALKAAVRARGGGLGGARQRAGAALDQLDKAVAAQ
jgi:predicted outer membrane repeat protein